MKTLKRFFRKVETFARNHFAPYGVIDNCGTRKLCWTMNEAKEWLPYCGTHAAIGNIYTGTLQIKRVQW